MVTGEYYLHTNGSLIYKPYGDVESGSPCVVRIWSAASIGQTPQTFIRFLRGALVCGASKSEVERLAKHNKLDTFAPQWREQVYKHFESLIED